MRKFLIFGILFLYANVFCYTQNIGINSDGSDPETGVTLDIKGTNAKTATAFQNMFQIKSFDASPDALKLRLGIQTHATATSRYGLIDFADYTGGAPTYRSLSLQPSGGYVGIGTTSPTALFTLNNASGGGAQMRVYYQLESYSGIFGEIFHGGDGNFGNSYHDGGLYIKSHGDQGAEYSGGSMSFWTGDPTPVERIRIDKYGNVGIGITTYPNAQITTNPAKFQIDGDGSTILIPRKSTTGNPSGTNGMMYYNSADNKFRAYENGSWVNMASSLWTDNTNYISPNDNANVQIKDNGQTNEFIYVTRTATERHGIYVYDNAAYTAGTGFTNSTARAGIAAYDYNAASYEFGVAGWSYLDNDFSGAVFGGKWDASIWGCLGYKAAGGIDYAGYFSGNVLATGTVKVGAYTLPNTDGTNGQVLKTNGSGTLTWQADNTGVTGSGTATQVAFWSASTQLSSSANLYWDNTNSSMGIGGTPDGPNYKLHVLSGNAKLGNTTTGSLNKLYFGDGGYVYVGEDEIDDELYLRGTTIKMFPSSDFSNQETTMGAIVNARVATTLKTSSSITYRTGSSIIIQAYYSATCSSGSDVYLRLSRWDGTTETAIAYSATSPYGGGTAICANIVFRDAGLTDGTSYTYRLYVSSAATLTVENASVVSILIKE